MEDVKPGEFVNYHPNGNSTATQLPDNAETAPAIVVGKANDGGLHLNVFTADFTGEPPVKQAWGVPFKDSKEAKAGAAFWDYAE